MFVSGQLLLFIALGLCASHAHAATQRVTTTKCTTTSNLSGYKTTTIRASPITQTVRPLATSTSTVTTRPCIKTSVTCHRQNGQGHRCCYPRTRSPLYLDRHLHPLCPLRTPSARIGLRDALYRQSCHLILST
ncbi:hypothetical protein V8E36_000815 [Tilletia maclaganii]